jgi:hypothetical protein
MAVHSKPIYTIVDREGNKKAKHIIVQGFNTRYGKDYRDVHYWCEDEFGKIIDTTPIQQKNRLNDGKKVYIKWDNQEKCIQEYSKPCWEHIMKTNDIKDTPSNRKRILNYITDREQYYTVRGCMMNAMAYQNKHKNLKVCIGSFGFQISPALIDLVWGL